MTRTTVYPSTLAAIHDGESYCPSVPSLPRGPKQTYLLFLLLFSLFSSLFFSLSLAFFCFCLPFLTMPCQKGGQRPSRQCLQSSDADLKVRSSLRAPSWASPEPPALPRVALAAFSKASHHPETSLLAHLLVTFVSALSLLSGLLFGIFLSTSNTQVFTSFLQ